MISTRHPPALDPHRGQGKTPTKTLLENWEKPWEGLLREGSPYQDGWAAIDAEFGQAEYTQYMKVHFGGKSRSDGAASQHLRCTDLF